MFQFVGLFLYMAPEHLKSLNASQSHLKHFEVSFCNLTSENNVGIFFYIHYTVCATIFQGTEKQTFKYRWILCNLHFKVVKLKMMYKFQYKGFLLPQI